MEALRVKTFPMLEKELKQIEQVSTDSYAKIICAIKPRAFVMENVDRARKSNAYAMAREEFKKAGYGLTEIVLDASLCGTPQKRKRFICFGMQNKEDDFATNSFKVGFSKKHMTLRDYFGDSLGFESIIVIREIIIDEAYFQLMNQHLL